jgi:hypothetical protein
MKMFFVTVLLVVYSQTYGQIDHYYFGIDFGLNREINQVVSNDNDYFSCYYRCWSDKDGFYLRNGSFSLSAGVEMKNKMVYEIMFSRQTENVSIQYLLPWYLVSDGSIGMAVNSSRTLFKWSAGVGRRISLGKQFYYIPFLQFSSVLPGYDTDIIVYSDRSNQSYVYNESLRYINENQIFLGFKNTLQWKPSSRWSINLQLGYAQGLSKIYEIHQEIQFLDDPENVSKGHTISRLSHIFASLGTSYIFKKN